MVRSVRTAAIPAAAITVSAGVRVATIVAAMVGVVVTRVEATIGDAGNVAIAVARGGAAVGPDSEQER